ncbi:hypothetical protein D3C71_194920 [compost metagenome]
MIRQSLLAMALLTACTTAAQAQFTVGAQYGLTISRTDATPNGINNHYGVYGEWQSGFRFLSLAISWNGGTLSGGNQETANDLYYSNKYNQGDLQLKVYPLRTFGKSDSSRALYYLSGVYAAGGFGLIGSSTTVHEVPNGNFRYQGDYSGVNTVVPVSFGIEIPLRKAFQQKGLSLNFKYQINYCMTDKIDGYDPDLTSNKSKDVYNMATFGLSYSF